MAALKSIKLKIKSVEKTAKVTKAMEAVSAAKMRKAQQKALMGRAYARAASAILARVSGARELATHPLTSARPVENSLYIAITSDKGLAGALNSAVLRAIVADIPSGGSASVIAVGRKANDFFTAREIPVETYFPNTDQITSEFIAELVRTAASRFASGKVDVVKIAYQNFVSTFEQRPTIRTVFPLSLDELEAVVEDILPARGQFALQPVSKERPVTYTIEPSEEEVLNTILPKLAGIFVYHALLETQASEHSARMVAMKSASDKAKDLTKGLTIQFNKARQAAITREVSEITGGMEAMAN
ncbi:ATP synthase F1 subunit gamma [Acetobacteraceae bacterium]|nr:ATP synthase F1 subunit gamma [Candidatus Parcubacteria bacterium]